MLSQPVLNGGVRVDLTDRVALVTGSSRGLGAATARRLAAMGADVIVTYRKNSAAADDVADDVRKQGRTAWVSQLDMSDVASIDDMFDRFNANGGDGPSRLDILVVSAAATSLKPLMEQQPHNIEATFAITVTGFIRAVQRAVPLMEAHGTGRVVAVSGIDTTSWAPAHGLLGAAKSAMETLVHYFQVELGNRGITFVGVNPDAFYGDSVKLMLGPLYDYIMDVNRAVHPLRHSPTPEDYSEVVALMCTDAATWLAGNTALADGGSSFAGRGTMTGLLGAIPQDIVCKALHIETSEAPAEDLAATAAPSVPKL